MDHHVRALGWAYILYGAISAILSLIAVVWFGSLREVWDWAEISGGFPPLLVGFLLAHLILGIPMVIGGIFILRLEEWARMMMVVVSALNVLNVPVGSALAAYGLWVLLAPETEPLFVDPIFKSKSGGAGRQSQMAGNLPPKQRSVTGLPPAIKAVRTNLPE